MYKRILRLLAVVTVLSAAIPSQASEKVLYNFCKQAGCPDGANPVADLVVDGSGNVWGTAKNGGQHGFGTIFELTASSGFTQLGQSYSFQGSPTGDGANPVAGLVYDPMSGNLYGTTSSGGSGPCDGGCGTIFALQSGTGTYQILHYFSGADGANPMAELILDAAGNLYGTTANGGQFGNGTVFQSMPIMPGVWTTTVIYSFRGSVDGANPVAGLVFDGHENLWGTARNGGANGFGTIFELTAPSFGLGHVYSFRGLAFGDGANPAAALVFDALDVDGGYLYGTTSAGGSSKCTGGCGTLFEQHPVTGAYQRIFSLTGANGEAPVARLALETDSGNDNYGSLYGTASLGGSTAGVCGTAGCGTAFEICPPTQSCTWKYASLFHFNGVKGQNPAAGMLLFPAAHEDQKQANPFQTGRGGCTTNCVGTAGEGGSSGDGVVYQITGP